MSARTHMDETDSTGYELDVADAEPGMSMDELASALRKRAGLLLVGPLLAGALALGVTMLIAPTFTASTSFLPPQQGQSAAASALASLGSLAGLAGGGAGTRNSADQYVALMQSVTVSDRLIERFKLLETYELPMRVDARNELAKNVRISVGKKDGLITVEVDDKSAQRATDIANRYVDELRQITGTLAVTEAQQRRVFFERQLQQSQGRLVQAQQTLQASGFNPGALKAEPKAAAESYVRLKAEATAVEVRLQILRGNLADDTPEVRQQQAALAALRAQLARAEQSSDTAGGPDYVSKYRDFKYQETLFDLYARQLELAKLDESREGSLIQVVDPATPPEKKSKPRRAYAVISTTLVMAVLLVVWVAWREARRLRAGLHAAPMAQ